ncbi:MAG: hypothetical protein ACI9JN_000502 [Bacteroidia bacterium]
MIQTSKTFFKTLRILHLALIAGASVFLILAIYLVETGGFDGGDPELNNVFQIVAPLMAGAGVFASRFLFTKRRAHIVSEKTLQAKTIGYQSALTVRYALIEGPTLFATIAFMLTSNYLFAYIGFALLIYLFLQRPTLESALTDLNLSHTDFDKVRNPDAIIFDNSTDINETE